MNLMHIKSILVVPPNNNKYLATSICINKYIFNILLITHTHQKKKIIYKKARLKLKFFFKKIPKPTRSTSVQLHPKPD